VRSECGRCRGRMVGLSPFERLLQDGVGAAVWVASASGEPGPPCPFCSRPMRRVPAEAGPDGLATYSERGADGLAVCRTCQEVWVPASAAGWMHEHAAPHGEEAGCRWSESVLPCECPNCGAPLQPDPLGRCRYCHAQVSAPAPIVIEPPGEDAGPGHDLLGILTGLFTRPL
jgi:hypothetical protein